MFFRFLVAALMVLAIPNPAIAEIKIFGQITLDIPPTWVAEQDKNGLYLTAQDSSSVVSILRGTLAEGALLGEVANKLSQKFNGTVPQDRGDGKSFYFFYSDSKTGHRAVSMVTAIGKYFIYITQVGENAEADAIIRSMRYNQGR